MTAATPPTPTAPVCPHGLRPGTTVCLRCKQDARAAARQHRIKIGTRFGVIALGGGALVALLVAGLTAIASDARSRASSPPKVAEQSPPRVTPKPPPAAPSAVQPVIAEGRKSLGDSMYAERRGDEVTVTFDTDDMRTRFDWKFEGVVRATLPRVYGAEARAALDSVPSGKFVQGGDLIRELPSRGISLALPHGRTLRVWPVTRPGRDGPIVIGYRAVGAR